YLCKSFCDGLTAAFSRERRANSVSIGHNGRRRSPDCSALLCGAFDRTNSLPKKIPSPGGVVAQSAVVGGLQFANPPEVPVVQGGTLLSCNVVLPCGMGGSLEKHSTATSIARVAPFDG